MAEVTIDHAILIPALKAVVWSQISNPNNNPVWQADCDGISFLTSNQQGRGARWRHAHPSGKDYVLELLAWYDGSGYAYAIIDGAPNKGWSRGHIRLQEVAEGTIVQWTVTYEKRGVGGGTKRRINRNMINSLRNLYSLVKERGGDSPVHIQDVKSVMRDAPDASQRSNYTPRHPSAYEERIKREQGESTPQPMPPVQAPQADPLPSPFAQRPAQSIPEPPVAEDDTQPNPATRTADNLNAVSPDVPPQRIPDTDPDAAYKPPTERRYPDLVEPSFLQAVPDVPAKPAHKPPTDTDTGYRPSLEPEITLDDTGPSNAVRTESEHVTQKPASEPDASLLDTSETAAVRGTSAPETPAQRQPVHEDQPKEQAEQEAHLRDLMRTPTPGAQPPVQPEQPAASTYESRPSTEPARSTSDIRDTSQVSVFEIFGLQKPSETSQMQAITPEQEAAAAAALQPESSPPGAVAQPTSETGETLQAKPTANPNTAPSALYDTAQFMSGGLISPDVQPEAGQRRVGLRARQRRKQVRIRRPTD